MKLIDAVRARTEKVRELLAAEVFAWEAVTAAIGAAAGEGLDAVTIAPATPVNLKDTEAGKAAHDRLHKHGFRVWWEMRRDRPDGPTYPVLVVEWPAPSKA